MARAVSPLASVVRRLTAAGYDRAFVKSVLPDWWEDEIAEHPTGLEEAVGRFSTALGVLPASLRTGERATFATDVEPRFKLRKGVQSDDLQPLRMTATQALRLACIATPTGPFPAADPVALRQHILAAGHTCVTLAALLDVCWGAGIPVLHIGQKVGPKKMDGMTARFGDRYGIVLCANLKHPSRLAFVLAHELGHVLLGHLPHDGVLVDTEGVGTDSDGEEVQANDFAWTLLTGSPEFKAGIFPRAKAEQITREARSKGDAARVAPGAVAASHGYAYPKLWGAVTAALNVLEPGQDGIDQVRHAAEQHLDVDRMSDDTAEYLARLVGLSLPDGVA